VQHGHLSHIHLPLLPWGDPRAACGGRAGPLAPAIMDSDDSDGTVTVTCLVDKFPQAPPPLLVGRHTGGHGAVGGLAPESRPGAGHGPGQLEIQVRRAT
jgi:hypothetical protein